jgi:hypothetical protein
VLPNILIVKPKKNKTMKNKHLLLSTLFFLSLLLNAQENQSSNFKSNHELSIIVDNVFAKNNFENIWYTNDYGDVIGYYPSKEGVTPEIGLGYKFHLPGSAIRFKISGTYNNSEDKDDDYGYKNELTYLSSKIALGYEFHKNMQKTQFFYGLDVNMNFSELKSKYTRDSYIYNYENTYTSETTTNYTAYGVSPLFGIKFYLNPSLSLSTELRYNVLFYKEEGIYKRSTSDEKDKDKTKGFKTDFGPLGQISFNIHL